MAEDRPCPACQQGRLRKHCEKSALCSWHKCRACFTTFDLAAKRGFFKDGRLFPWPKAAS